MGCHIYDPMKTFYFMGYEFYTSYELHKLENTMTFTIYVTEFLKITCMGILLDSQKNIF